MTTILSKYSKSYSYFGCYFEFTLNVLFLRIWNLNSGLIERTLYGHSDSVLCLQFDNEKFISGSADKTIKVHKLIYSHFILLKIFSCYCNL